MSYVPGTILTRKNPFEEPAPGAPDLRAYNEVRVIGPSPVQTSARVSEWSGQLGDNISVTPTSFGEVLDRPFGELQHDYDVLFIPEPAGLLTHTVTVEKPGPSPEEQFRTAEAEEGLRQSDEREQTPLAPVTDPDA